MFRFTRDQKIYDVAGVKVGGQPGQFPTVMIGSIFYHKHKLVIDEKTGDFDKIEAEKVLMVEKEISLKTGNPRIVDVCASSPQAFEKFIDFIADKTEGPFCIDGTTADVRIAGAKYVGNVGLSKRVIYNSIVPEVQEDEINAIKEAGIKSAILLLLNTRNPLINGRFEVIDDLLRKALMAGVENILVDTAIFDVLDPGPSSKAIYLIKEKYGYPAGCGAHNAIDIWHKRVKLSADVHFSSTLIANIVPVIMGANFMLYGPIENATKIYMPIALADAFVAYTAWQENGVKPATKSHPFFNLHKIAELGKY